MSLEAMLFYLDCTDIKSNEKLCMIALADHANDEGECYPGQTRIATRLSMSWSGARKVLYRLKEKGHLEILEGKGVVTKNGITNRYRLLKYIESKGVPHGTGLQDGCPTQDRVGCPPQDRVPCPPQDNKPNTLTQSSNPKDTLSSREAAQAQPPLIPSERAPKPKPKKKSAYVNKDTGVSTTDIRTAYLDCLDRYEEGAQVSHGQIGRTSKAMAQNGVTPKQVTETFTALKQDRWWQSKHVSLETVGKHMGARKPTKGCASWDTSNPGHPARQMTPERQQFLDEFNAKNPHIWDLDINF